MRCPANWLVPDFTNVGVPLAAPVSAIDSPATWLGNAGAYCVGANLVNKDDAYTMYLVRSPACRMSTIADTVQPCAVLTTVRIRVDTYY